MSVEPVGGATAPTPARAVDARTQRAAEGFERVLLGQLTTQLADAATGERAGPYATLLPDALADALADAGGIGLAASLGRSAPR